MSGIEPISGYEEIRSPVKIMRAVVQRVLEARVSAGDEILGAIGPGLCILLGVRKGDAESDAEFLAAKIKHLRVFEDDRGKMNRSVLDLRGELLVVSQFTLYADCRKGNRPSFTDAAAPELAEILYGSFTQYLRDAGLKVATGRFQAHMKVSLVNDGPVTLILESRL